MDQPAVVIDTGSFLTKAGYGGDSSPRITFQTRVGRARIPANPSVLQPKDWFIGDELSCVGRNRLEYRSTFDGDGIVADWDNMEKIWRHSFYTELRTAPEGVAVLLTEPPLNPKAERERLAQIMFDAFSVPALYVGIHSVLGLYASGRTTGLVVESGSISSYTVPIVDGNAIPHAVQRLGVAGRDISDAMMDIIRRSNDFDPLAYYDQEIVRDIKEKLAVVSLDYDSDVRSGSMQQRSYELPDGNEITICNELLHCAEVLFRPSLVGKGAAGIHACAFETLSEVEQDYHSALFANVLLCGGTTKTTGFAERMAQELRSLAHSSASSCTIVAPDDRQYSAWLGGSVLSALSTFREMCVTKVEYEEHGASVVHRKCGGAQAQKADVSLC
jgi:actin-related protein